MWLLDHGRKPDGFQGVSGDVVTDAVDFAESPVRFFFDEFPAGEMAGFEVSGGVSPVAGDMCSAAVAAWFRSR